MMHLYNVRFQKFEAMDIFASNAEEADHLVQIYLGLNHIEAAEYEICCPVLAKHLSTLECIHMQAASAMNSPGCGVYDSHAGWKIVPLWYQQPTQRLETAAHNSGVSGGIS